MTNNLTRAQDQVILFASAAIRDRMKIGSEKYDPTTWCAESVQRHAHRAIRHLVTGLEIIAGDRPADGEDHLQAAICRAAMALAVKNQRNGD